MLPDEILPLSKVYPGNLDGTLPLEKAYYVRNGILGGNRDQHMDMVGGLDSLETDLNRFR